jgi:hypothetical protein
MRLLLSHRLLPSRRYLLSRCYLPSRRAYLAAGLVTISAAPPSLPLPTLPRRTKTPSPSKKTIIMGLRGD